MSKELNKAYRPASLSHYSFKERLTIHLADWGFYLLILLIGRTIRFEVEGWENFEAIEKARKLNERSKKLRGASTISQQTANSGAGFINHIDYTTGEIRVGGKLSFTNGVATDTLDPANPGTRVHLNDPTGGFGRKLPASPDPRMTLDPPVS